MTNTTSSVRVTKAQRFADIRAMLCGEAIVNGTTVDEALMFIDHEVELLTRKNTSADKRQNATQKANEGYMAEILDYLATLDGEGKTCSEIGKAIPSLFDFNTSKLSSLCNTLVKRGLVVKATVKGKSIFKLA